jgi:hypothetical protein
MTMTKTNRRRRPTAEDAQCGPMPKYFGRGANIRIITPDGQTVQSNPREYKRLEASARRSLVSIICKSLGVVEDTA